MFSTDHERHSPIDVIPGTCSSEQSMAHYTETPPTNKPVVGADVIRGRRRSAAGADEAGRVCATAVCPPSANGSEHHNGAVASGRGGNHKLVVHDDQVAHAVGVARELLQRDMRHDVPDVDRAIAARAPHAVADADEGIETALHTQTAE